MFCLGGDWDILRPQLKCQSLHLLWTLKKECEGKSFFPLNSRMQEFAQGMTKTQRHGCSMVQQRSAKCPRSLGHASFLTSVDVQLSASTSYCTKVGFTKLMANWFTGKPPWVCTTGSSHCCWGQLTAGCQPSALVSMLLPETANFWASFSKICTSRVTCSSLLPFRWAASEAAPKPKCTSMSKVRIFCMSALLSNKSSSTDHSEPSTSIFTWVERATLLESRLDKELYFRPCTVSSLGPRQVRNAS